MVDKDVQIALVTNLPAILAALSAAGAFNAIGTWWAARQAKQARDETRAGNAVLADVHASVKTITDQSMSGANAAATGAAVALAATDQQSERVAELTAEVERLKAENERLKSRHHKAESR